MVQREVAERICANGQTPRQVRGKMNLLAASVQFWANVKIIDVVAKGNFRPIPKVDSAIIKLEIRDRYRTDQEKYYKFIRILFQQPRKTIFNNISSGFESVKKEEILEKLQNINVSPIDRPQNLSLKQIIELSTLF